MSKPTTQVVLTSLEDDKAEDIVSPSIFAANLPSRTCSSSPPAARRGTSARWPITSCVKLKEAGVKDVRVEGMPQADWVLVDAGDVVVHLFRPGSTLLLQHREDLGGRYAHDGAAELKLCA
jgi:ribosome-associated protein